MLVKYNQGLNPDRFFGAAFLFRFTVTKNLRRKNARLNQR